MVKGSFVRRRAGRVLGAIVCIVLIAPLTGCSLAATAFAALGANTAAFWGFMPLRSVVGTIIRDTFVGIF